MRPQASMRSVAPASTATTAPCTPYTGKSGATNRMTTGTTAAAITASMVTKVDELCFTTRTSLSQLKTGSFSLIAMPALAPNRM